MHTFRLFFVIVSQRRLGGSDSLKHLTRSRGDNPSPEFEIVVDRVVDACQQQLQAQWQVSCDRAQLASLQHCVLLKTYQQLTVAVQGLDCLIQDRCSIHMSS